MLLEIEKKKFKINKIVFYNNETKWGVLAAEPIDDLGKLKDELINQFSNITLSGGFEGAYEGAEVEVSGNVIDTLRYGKQIQISYLKVHADARNKDSVINFLSKSIISGISTQNAAKIYDKFKEKSIDVVLNFPNKLIEINGIGEKTVAKVKSSVNYYKSIEPLVKYCTSIGLPYSLIVKLNDALGDKALSVIQREPFKILELTSTISFKQVDDIYLRNGGSPSSPIRLKTGLLYTLKKLVMLEGSTGCNAKILKRKYYDMLNIEETSDFFNTTVANLEKENKIVVEGKLPDLIIYYKEYLDVEQNIATSLKLLEKEGLMGIPIREEIIQKEINNFPYTLNEQQVKAVHDCLKHNVAVLTGPAGCVDCDTEYFNGEAWVPISNYKEGDKVLQYNKDGSAELVTPLRYVKKPCKELNFMHNCSGSINQVLSDDHRFIYLSSKGNINEKLFKDIKEILNEKHSFSADLIFNFNCVSEVPTNLTPERLRLMIAISADGSLYRSGNFWRIRLKKERKIERFRKLLKEAKVENYNEVNYADGYTNFRVPVEYGCKEFPTYFYLLPKNLKDVFCEEIVLWDGSTKCGKREVRKYFSSIKKNADIVQFLLAQGDTRVSMTIDDRIGKSHSNSKYTYKSKNFAVHETKTKTVSLLWRKGSPPITIEKYIPKDGLQYCFTVPSGMLVLRRNNNIFVTGNCGKSTITKALYRIYEEHEYNVILLSPTAKACRRLEECTGGIAQTIHKFLGMRADGSIGITSNYARNTVFIIDEASMMDILLFNHLLKGITPTTRIILVGDNNQLPSVQAGNVLGDLIDSGEIHVSMLSDVMRQQENSNIIKYCSMINKGEIMEPCEHTDFHYEEFGTKNELLELFLPKYMEEVEKNGLSEVQVIAPYKKGELGMDNLNKYLQEIYQKERNGELCLEPYRIGDRVRHTQNNYKKEVFNGEVGVVVGYDEGDLIVDYGNKTIIYDNKDIDELTLSYAATVHSSQGSEYKVVFVILDDTSINDFLHIRRLLYTAVSRGKEKVYILTKPYLVDKCIENNSYRPRITKLEGFLREDLSSSCILEENVLELF